MFLRPRLSFLVVLAGAAASVAHGAEPGGCDAFGLDVKRELALIGAPARAIAAHRHLQEAGIPLVVDQHYLLQLHPQNTVAFIAGRATRDGALYGGIGYFHVRDAGRYRIAIDTRHWIEVIDSGPDVFDAAAAHVVASVAHEGRSDCAALRKVVVFELEAGKTYRLHFSGEAAAQVNLLITRETSTAAAAARRGEPVSG